MKLNYSRQLTLTILLVLVGNVLSTIFKHWIYRNIGFFIGGLIWIFHPVMAGNRAPTAKELRLIQILCGGVLILIALFTRSYTY